MRCFWCLVCLSLPLLALAQQEMEIIPLRHRTVAQVMPVLQDLLEPGDTLSGMNVQVSSQKSGNLSTDRSQGYDNRSVWLMVEEVR